MADDIQGKIDRLYALSIDQSTTEDERRNSSAALTKLMSAHGRVPSQLVLKDEKRARFEFAESLMAFAEWQREELERMASVPTPAVPLRRYTEAELACEAAAIAGFQVGQWLWKKVSDR